MLLKTFAEPENEKLSFQTDNTAQEKTNELNIWFNNLTLTNIKYFTTLNLYTGIKNYITDKKIPPETKSEFNTLFTNLFPKSPSGTIKNLTINDIDRMITNNFSKYGNISRNYIYALGNLDSVCDTVRELAPGWNDLQIALMLLSSNSRFNFADLQTNDLFKKLNNTNLAVYQQFDFSKLPKKNSIIPFKNNRTIELQGEKYQLLDTKNIEDCLQEENQTLIKIFDENNIQTVSFLKNIKTNEQITVPLNYLEEMNIKPNLHDYITYAGQCAGLIFQALRQLPANIVKGAVFFILRAGTVIPLFNLSGELHFLVYAPSLRPIHNQPDGIGFSHYGDNAYRKIFKDKKIIMNWHNPPRVVLQGPEFSLVDHNRFIAAKIEKKWILVKVVERQYLDSI